MSYPLVHSPVAPLAFPCKNEREHPLYPTNHSSLKVALSA